MVAVSEGVKTVAAVDAVATDCAVVMQEAEAESVGRNIHQKTKTQTARMRIERNLDPLNRGHGDTGTRTRANCTLWTIHAKLGL